MSRVRIHVNRRLLERQGIEQAQRRQQQAHDRRQALLDAMLRRELRRLPAEPIGNRENERTSH